jgi:hypothetical protein
VLLASSGSSLQAHIFCAAIDFGIVDGHPFPFCVDDHVGGPDFLKFGPAEATPM